MRTLRPRSNSTRGAGRRWATALAGFTFGPAAALHAQSASVAFDTASAPSKQSSYRAENDGNFVINRADGAAIWASNPVQP